MIGEYMYLLEFVIFGSVNLNADEFKAIMASMTEFIDFLPVLKNREFLIKKGNDIKKIKLGLIPKKTKATIEDINNESYPMVEFNDHEKAAGDNKMLELVSCFFQGLDGTIDLPEAGYKVHRLEEFAGWFGDGWETFARLLSILMNILGKM